jgi:signal peptidase I
MKDVKIINRDCLAEAILSSDTDFPLTVTGSSMAPLIKDGRTVVLLTRTFTPAKGRILLFRRIDGTLILHRVRKVGKDYLVMNGDAQGWCEIIKPSQAIAAVNYIKIMGKNVKYNSPLLRIWDSIWYLTFPVRRLFCLHSKL